MLKDEFIKKLNGLGISTKNNVIRKSQALSALNKVLGTGQMGKEDLEPGGEFHSARITLEGLCEEAGIGCKVQPFDVYQGPYALLSNGAKIWFTEEPEVYFYDGKEQKTLDEDALVDYLKNLKLAKSKPASTPQKPLRAPQALKSKPAFNPNKSPKLVYINPSAPRSSSSKKPDLKLLKSALIEILAADPSSKPPKKWWNKMYKQVKENNPSYSDEQVRKTIGKIWYQRLKKSKRSQIRKREGKKLK